MLGLGLASSHAPAMFEPAERWPKVYAGKPLYTNESQPHTAKLETPAVIDSYIGRINAAMQELRQQIANYRPDALVVIGDDQNDVFDDSNNPTFSIYTGDSLWGLTGTDYTPMEERKRIDFNCHQSLAQQINKSLVGRGFDMANIGRFNPLARPHIGVSHMVSYPIPVLVPDQEVPIVPIFLNEYFPPLPTAERCYELGQALGEILEQWQGRVAIYASGGLSHDPVGPRAGWVDEPLDHWFLERLQYNELDPIKHMFTFDSDTMRGGTGEIRAWIVAAAAMQRPAKVIDYISAHHAKCGLGFAYWPILDERDNQ